MCFCSHLDGRLHSRNLDNLVTYKFEISSRLGWTVALTLHLFALILKYILGFNRRFFQFSFVFRSGFRFSIF